MKKILIGVSSPANETARTAISVIAEEFNIEHITMRQPIINMIAALTEQHPTVQEFSTPQNTKIDGLKSITIGYLENALSFNLRAMNPAFFIERTQKAIKKSNQGLNGQLFGGHLISGIRTELEAQWVRDQGGLMVHLYHYDNLSEFHALQEMNGDLVAVINNTNPTKNNLIASLSAIDAQLKTTQKAA